MNGIHVNEWASGTGTMPLTRSFMWGGKGFIGEASLNNVGAL